MKDRLSKIRPYAVHILWACIFISVIRTSYSIYEKQNQKISEIQRQLDNTNTQADTKQAIRIFFEAVNPEILQRIDAGSILIPVRISYELQKRLSKLSQYPDFNDFLSYKKIEKESVFIANYGSPIKELNKNDVILANYHLFPKETLIK